VSWYRRVRRFRRWRRYSLPLRYTARTGRRTVYRWRSGIRQRHTSPLHSTSWR